MRQVRTMALVLVGCTVILVGMGVRAPTALSASPRTGALPVTPHAYSGTVQMSGVDATPESSKTNPIVGVWIGLYGGAVIDVRAHGHGFIGIVTHAYKTFDSLLQTGPCTHQVGQRVWTNITQHAKGRYSGINNGFYVPSCIDNPRPITFALSANGLTLTARFTDPPALVAFSRG